MIVACLLLAASGCEQKPEPAPATEPAAAPESAPPEAAAPTQPVGRPDVLLVIVDTLRADRLPAYGYGSGKTPTLDRLTDEAVVFDRAVAASAATVPSHASLFTSRFVRQHSVGYSNGDTILGDEETVASHFQKAGYATAGFISNVMLNELTGLGRGFDVYDDRLPNQEENRPLFFERDAPKTTQSAISWLKKAGDRPVFLLVHYQDPHGPYTPPDRVLREVAAPAAEDEPRLAVTSNQVGYRGLPAYQALEGLDRPSQYESRYLAEILFMDRWMGLLLRAFEEHREGAGHIILFTSDHGESMGEEGYWFAHGHTSMPDLAHIPFILRAPGLKPGRREDPVSHVDVLPTLLELSGIPVPDDAVGVALGPYLREGQSLPERELYCDLGVETGVYDGAGMTRIRFPSFEAADAGDTSDAAVNRYRWTEEGALVEEEADGSLGETTAAYLSNVKTPRLFDNEPEPDHVERLRALGYIEPAESAD